MNPSRFRALLPVAIVYAASVGIMMLGEALISKYLGAELYGQFRVIQAAGPVVATVGFMGYSSAITRLVAEGHGEVVGFTRPVVSRMAFTGVSALVAAIAISMATGIGPEVALAVVPLSIGLSAVTLAASIQKAINAPLLAAFTQQGHRLVCGAFFVALVLLGLEVSHPGWILGASCVGVGLGGSIWLLRYREKMAPSQEEHRKMVRLGHGFFLSAVAVSLTDFVDQLLVASIGGSESAGVYGTIKLFIVYPILSLASILSFIALPAAVRVVRYDSFSRIRRSVMRWALSSFLFALLVGPAGASALLYFYDYRFNIMVVALLAFTGFLRLYYVWASALLGALSVGRELHAVGAISLIAVALMPAWFFVIPNDTIMAAALAVCFAYLVRILSVTLFVFRASSSARQA